MKQREKMETDLLYLESQFRDRLIGALRKCANGTWGLFGGYDSLVEGPSRTAALSKYPQLIESREILRLGERVEELRRKLGYHEPFQLHQRLLEYRRMRRSNDPGEPKLAMQFLAELRASQTTTGA